jgi:uncharacterized protein YuzE
MKLNYYPDTDLLYIHLSDKPGADAVEISEHVVVEWTRQVSRLELTLMRTRAR